MSDSDLFRLQRQYEQIRNYLRAVVSKLPEALREVFVVTCRESPGQCFCGVHRADPFSKAPKIERGGG